ncbi:MAG: hypothetical protein VB099_18210, partial [Candidatus Limiplasma sp.]|nr:hypothetical protein [Candidatus Limiplasma sp.]
IRFALLPDASTMAKEDSLSNVSLFAIQFSPGIIASSSVVGIMPLSSKMGYINSFRIDIRIYGADMKQRRLLLLGSLHSSRAFSFVGVILLGAFSSIMSFTSMKN